MKCDAQLGSGGVSLIPGGWIATRAMRNSDVLRTVTLGNLDKSGRISPGTVIASPHLPGPDGSFCQFEAKLGQAHMTIERAEEAFRRELNRGEQSGLRLDTARRSRTSTKLTSSPIRYGSLTHG